MRLCRFVLVPIAPTLPPGIHVLAYLLIFNTLKGIHLCMESNRGMRAPYIYFSGKLSTDI
ncbi:unnamed protein product [Phytomonas sp. EM1]|nr:unnamed protein product [Phytomonas sp. EM1]|eukprot:CCW62515.1 unnamed protein product [Phytomonas sp. isolate EM1]